MLYPLIQKAKQKNLQNTLSTSAGLDTSVTILINDNVVPLSYSSRVWGFLLFWLEKIREQSWKSYESI